MKKRTTQQEIIKEYLIEGHNISAPHALINWQIMRLGSVISELRKQGLDIKTRLKKNSDRTGSFAVYYLDPQYINDYLKANIIEFI